MPVCINSVLHHLPMFLLWEKTFETYKQIISIICKKMLSIKKTNINNPIEGFPGGAVVGGLPANAGDAGSGPGLGGSHMPRSN